MDLADEDSITVGRTGRLSDTATAIRHHYGGNSAFDGMALIDARADAEHDSQAEYRFTATMSHEIQTPIDGVIDMPYLLCRTRFD